MSGLIRTAKRYVKLGLRMGSERWAGVTEMVSDLRALGVRPGGLLLVHSSLSSLGYVRGGREAVIRALTGALGRDGTLVMPTHSWELMENGGRVFDSRETPSCVGAITELFRKMPGVQRSLHPTHSVAAIGPLARELIQDHQYAATPCGAGTPYEKLLNLDGQILFLGAKLDSNSAYHTIEALGQVPYLMKPSQDYFSLIDATGQQTKRYVHRHEAAIPRRFNEWGPLLETKGVLVRGNVGKAPSQLMQGKPFLDVMMEMVAADPLMFLQSHH